MNNYYTIPQHEFQLLVLISMNKLYWKSKLPTATSTRFRRKVKKLFSGWLDLPYINR